MTSLINETFKYSELISNNRDAFYILTKCIEELGELAVEVQIASGLSHKQVGVDGVVGEAIDLITCVLDLIHTMHPMLTEEDLLAIAKPKLEKWKSKATFNVGRVGK